MKLFEIHITGVDSSIIYEFSNLGLKTLSIGLLDRLGRNVGDEYMCSVRREFNEYQDCLQWVCDLILKLKSKISRVKIETPLYEEFLPITIYSEVHIPGGFEDLPTVYNKISNKFVSTERTYDPKEFLSLREKWSLVKGSEFELCLYDSNKEFDDFWLSHWS